MKAEIAGVELGCVLDTGAEASIIPSDVFHSAIEPSTGNADSLSTAMRIIGVTGTEVPVEGYIRARVRVEGREAMVGFLIIPSGHSGRRRQDFPVLLGCNALRALLHDDVQVASTEFQFAQTCLNLPKRPEMTAQVISEADETVLPARSVTSVKCALDAPQERQGGDRLGWWLVGGDTGYSASIQVMEGCIPDSPSPNLLLINTSDEQVVLPPNSKVASAVWLQEQREIAVQIVDDSIQVDIHDMLVISEGSTEDPDPPYSQTQDNHSSKFSPMQDPNTQEPSLPAGISLGELSPENVAKVEQLLHEHSAVFSRDEFDLGHCNLIPHEIKVSSDKHIRMPYRRISPSETTEVRQLLQDMLDKHVIKRSASPYASPVVLVRKKSGAIRLCIDYRQLNTITIKDSFPLPRIDESLEAMEGARYFSSLDLSHGYFQVTMHPDSIPLTAFRVPWGLFEFQRMPQGLCNSPSTFQRTMELIFGDMNFTQLILYLDDILVFSKTFEEYLTRLGEVFSRLAKHGLKLKGEKCQLFQTEVAHLGHIVNENGVMVDPEKVEKITNWPTPKTASELSSFLGLASYYRRFVPDFAKIAGPLHSLTGKKTRRKAGKRNTGSVGSEDKFVWTPEAEESFRQLKERLSSAPVLAYPKFGEGFVLEVDASLQGLGACLSQADEKGHLHPIAYASRTLRGAEKRYPDFSSFKIEFLALKWAVVEKFKGYLMGAKCVVYTDNNPLAHLQTAQLGATEQRWVAQLASFNLEIKYRPGRLNRCADALSRYPETKDDDASISVDEFSIGTALPVEVIESGEELSEETVTSVPCVYPSYSPPQLAQMQQDDETLGVFYKAYHSGWKPGDRLETNNCESKAWFKEFSKITGENGVLYRQHPSTKSGHKRQLLVPQVLRRMMLEMAHEQWGHQGISRTTEILRSRCFWPRLHQDVKDHVKKCFTCVTTKAPTPAICTPRRHLLAFRPMELVAIDFLKLDKGKGGYEDVLVITDAFTKYSQAVPCQDQTAPTVARALLHSWFVHYGAPLRLHSDQGRNFESALIRELCKLYGIEKSHTTPYHPEGNGQTERFNRTLCSMIRSLDPACRRKWPEMIQHLVFLYNATPHGTTGMSPYRLLYGREPYTPLDQLLGNVNTDWDEDFISGHAKSLQQAHDIAEENMRTAREAEKTRHDARPMSTPISIGTRVLLRKCAFDGRHKLVDKFEREPYIVTSVNKAGDVYRIRPLFGGPTKTVNRRLLIPDPRTDGQPLVTGPEPESTPRSHDRGQINKEKDPAHQPLDDEDDAASFVFVWNPPDLPDGNAHDDSIQCCRSSRPNKGSHSNPARLPRSVLEADQ